MKKILILMARFGGGHESIARAMSDALQTYGKGQFQIVIEDGFPPIVLISENYSAFFPLFKEAYHLTNNPTIAKIFLSTNGLLIKNHLSRIIKKTNADMIISNHPFLNCEVKKILRKNKKNVPFGIYFADAVNLHQFWFAEKEANFYFAPTRECERIALLNGIKRDKLYFIGWLLRSDYYKQKELNNYKKNLGFNEDKKLIYLSGGGDGYGLIEEISRLLLQNNYFINNCQLAVICGANHKLLVKMQKLQRKLSDNLFSFGYIHNAYDFKKAADVICSKSGPNDIFESIILEKPFFAHGYLWAHEGDNFFWLKKRNIGFAERDPEKMVKKIIACVKNPALLDEKIASVKKLREEHLNAPKILVQKISELLKF